MLTRMHSQGLHHITAITADLYEPRLRWATEGLRAMLTRTWARTQVAWARAAHDEETKLAALAVFQQVPLALNLLTDLERARQSGNPTKVAKVNRRLDRLLEPRRKRAPRPTMTPSRPPAAPPIDKPHDRLSYEAVDEPAPTFANLWEP